MVEAFYMTGFILLFIMYAYVPYDTCFAYNESAFIPRISNFEI